VNDMRDFFVGRSLSIVELASRELVGMVLLIRCNVA
jgi:hypothetical protein